MDCSSKELHHDQESSAGLIMDIVLQSYRHYCPLDNKPNATTQPRFSCLQTVTSSQKKSVRRHSSSKHSPDLCADRLRCSNDHLRPSSEDHSPLPDYDNTKAAPKDHEWQSVLSSAEEPSVRSLLEVSSDSLPETKGFLDRFCVAEERLCHRWAETLSHSFQKAGTAAA